MARVVVTGGTGFVGANLTRRLLAEGHALKLLVRPGHSTWRLAGIERDVQLFEIDLADRGELGRLLERERPERLFHLAAYGAYPRQSDWREMVRTNVVGTTSLLEVALDVGCEVIVNTGSSSEYGFTDHAPSEDERLRPNSYYAATKAYGTHIAQLLAAQHGARVVTLRLYSIYGPWEEPSRLIPQLVACCLRGTLPPLVRPEIARDYVYVDDAVDAYLKASDAKLPEPGPVFNVGSGRQVTLGELVGIAREIFAVPVEPQWETMQQRQWDTATWVADSKRAHQVLGWSTRTEIREGLRRTAAWLQTSPEIQQRYEEESRCASN